MTNRALPSLRRVGAVLAASMVALAACGGSDDDADGDAPTEDAGDASSADGGNDESGGGDASGDGGDASGDGSNDDAQETMDELGVDLDLDELEDTVTGLSTGEGGGVVTINGDAYAFTAEICIAQGPAFTAEGLAEGPDGTPAWVSVSYSNDFDFDGDGENDETLDIFVEVGKTELFGSGADDQPDFTANKIDAGALSTGEDITVAFDGSSISGGGPMQDFNFVALGPGETADMTFEASCS